VFLFYLYFSPIGFDLKTQEDTTWSLVFSIRGGERQEDESLCGLGPGAQDMMYIFIVDDDHIPQPHYYWRALVSRPSCPP
jgi:hypothetical protein